MEQKHQISCAIMSETCFDLMLEWICQNGEMENAEKSEMYQYLYISYISGKACLVRSFLFLNPFVVIYSQCVDHLKLFPNILTCSPSVPPHLSCSLLIFLFIEAWFHNQWNKSQSLFTSCGQT